MLEVIDACNRSRPWVLLPIWAKGMRLCISAHSRRRRMMQVSASKRGPDIISSCEYSSMHKHSCRQRDPFHVTRFAALVDVCCNSRQCQGCSRLAEACKLLLSLLPMDCFCPLCIQEYQHAITFAIRISPSASLFPLHCRQRWDDTHVLSGQVPYAAEQAQSLAHEPSRHEMV